MIDDCKIVTDVHIPGDKPDNRNKHIRHVYNGWFNISYGKVY